MRTCLVIVTFNIIIRDVDNETEDQPQRERLLEVLKLIQRSGLVKNKIKMMDTIY
jgi:hypothetical protein